MGATRSAGAVAHNGAVAAAPEIAERLERVQVPLYLGAIVVGVLVGLSTPRFAESLDLAVTPVLAALLFVTFLQIPIADLGKSLRDVRFLGAIAVVNFVVVPLVMVCLAPFVPNDTAIRIGVLLVLLCPCVDYVVVFTGLAGGSRIRLLAATPLLLLVQMILAPLLLLAFLGREVTEVIEPGPFVEAFVLLIGIPLALAWVVQAWAARTRAGRRFTAGADTTMVPLMMAVLAVVTCSQIPRVEERLGDLLAIIPVYVVFLIVMAFAGVVVGRGFRLDVASTRAVTFSGATRNSLVVLPLALALPVGYEAAAAAIVTQTLVELIGMVAYVWAIPRLVPDRSRAI